MADQKEPSTTSGRTRKKALMQSDVPAYSAKEALRVAEALRDQYGKQPTTPLMVAKALDMSPTSGHFKMITGASVAYGLTDGAAQAERIGLTEIGRRAVAPLTEGDDIAAFREAILKPRVVREFLERYNGSRVPPSRTIARNVLEDMGVPADASERALDMILENARSADFIEVVKGADYVTLDKVPSTPAPLFDHADEADPSDNEDVTDVVAAKSSEAEREGTRPQQHSPAGILTPPALTENNRVFITHGKNRAVVDQIKELLIYGDFEPVVSVERETLAKSIPDKVLDDMRSCNAGIVHVGSEMILKDDDGNEHTVLNSNVLIEIGAALALYGKRLILLVEEGTELPSNLQGLYQARYAGGELTHSATMKLLKTFNEFKKADNG
ncbi:TIR domain-containing protein [Mycobacterium paraintracellulare]|uniref:TIR domain-containing protein n=1 Tax=Mycobacterium paraintracellulare TaxID=1138383 RepID=UPI003891851E